MLTDSCEVVQYKQISVERKTTEPIENSRGSVPQYLRFESWGRYSKFKPEVKEMNILSITETSMGPVTCAVVDNRTAPELVRQYLEVRTWIWTVKYPEEAGENGLELDEFDDDSRYLVLFMEHYGRRIIVGGCRIIYEEDGRSLPVQACVDHSITGPAVEISRFFIETDVVQLSMEDSVHLLHDFVMAMNNLLIGEGYSYAYAGIRFTLYLKLVKTVPLTVERIGHAKERAGKKFVPIQVTLAHTHSDVHMNEQYTTL